ncbi:MAG TPA: hypothetical protein VGG26_08505 [Terracidiphilus sp.]|jgi:hypothetical protein
MATTHPTGLRSPVRRSAGVRLLDRYFYFFMSLLIAAVVIYGFGQTVSGNLLNASPPRPLLLYFHGACFSAWVAFFIFQSALVRTHNVRIHKLMGWFGAALGAAMVVLGYSIAVIMGRFNLHVLHQASAVKFLIVPFSDIGIFFVVFALAISWRKRPELHRRLMLVATCVLTSAAFGRFPNHFPPPLDFYYGVDLLIFLGVLRDLIVNRHVHKVYIYALPALFACQAAIIQVITHPPALWLRISGAILG